MGKRPKYVPCGDRVGEEAGGDEEAAGAGRPDSADARRAVVPGGDPQSAPHPPSKEKRSSMQESSLSAEAISRFHPYLEMSPASRSADAHFLPPGGIGSNSPF